MTTLVFGTVLPWLLLAAGTWLGYQLVRQNGRILLRLEAIEKKVTPRAPAQRREAGGLPVGTLAPDFELPDLAGVRRKLSEFRGQDVLLIFFNPKCGFCTKTATRTKTDGSSSSTPSAARSFSRSRCKSPRNIAPKALRWAIGSTLQAASPAS
jgi:hypothetical protein